MREVARGRGARCNSAIAMALSSASSLALCGGHAAAASKLSKLSNDSSYRVLSSNGSRMEGFMGLFPASELSNSRESSKHGGGALRTSASTRNPCAHAARRRSGNEAGMSMSGSGRGKLCVVRAERENEVLEAKGLTYDGPGKGGQWLSSTTRHVRIYLGVADPVTRLMDQTRLDKITLMLDPDDEFLWPEDKVKKVYDYFSELLDVYAGAAPTEYTLRLIGSDVEHYIRKLLLANEIKYNLNCRVLNFSMGKPRYDSAVLEEPGE